MVRHQKDSFVVIEYRCFRSAIQIILRILISLWRTLERRELGLVAEGFPWRCLVPPHGLGKCYMPLPLSLPAQVNLCGKSDPGRVEAAWGAHTMLNEVTAEPAHNRDRQICGTISEKDGTKTPFSPLPFSYILEKPQIPLSSKDSGTHGWRDWIPLAQSTTMHVNWC